MWLVAVRVGMFNCPASTCWLIYCALAQMLELSNICHCVQHPWKLTSKDFWSTRNERKPLSKQKCALRKCCGVSQKWWMLEQYASHLCSGTGGSIGQNRFICQVLCSGIQGISSLLMGGSWKKTIGQSRFICQVCVLVFKASLLWYWGVHWPK